jgi:hypothetical protein
VTGLSSGQLLEEVRRALEAKGCSVAVEIVKLWGAVPGQRNWEIATIGANCLEVQTRLGEKFQLRSRRRGAG